MAVCRTIWAFTIVVPKSKRSANFQYHLMLFPIVVAYETIRSLLSIQFFHYSILLSSLSNIFSRCLLNIWRMKKSPMCVSQEARFSTKWKIWDICREIPRNTMGFGPRKKLSRIAPTCWLINLFINRATLQRECAKSVQNRKSVSKVEHVAIRVWRDIDRATWSFTDSKIFHLAARPYSVICIWLKQGRIF